MPKQYNPQDLEAVPLLGLRPSRKADRAAFAAALVMLAESHGASAEVEHEATEVHVNITAPGGLAVRLWFNGDKREQGSHLIAWHLAFTAPAGQRLAPSFGLVNPHHGRKATHVARDLFGTYAEVHRGLTLAASGAAYVTNADPQQVAAIVQTCMRRRMEWTDHPAPTAAEIEREARGLDEICAQPDFKGAIAAAYRAAAAELRRIAATGPAGVLAYVTDAAKAMPLAA